MDKEDLKSNGDKRDFQNEHKYSERKDRILKLLRDRRNKEIRSISYGKTIERNKVSVILEKNKAEREELKNKDLKQNINLKRKTLIALFIFLAIETIFIFYYTWYQATKWYGLN